jgi:hypothetical protein
MINRSFFISHGETTCRSLLWSRRGSNPLTFGLQSNALLTKLFCPSRGFQLIYTSVLTLYFIVQSKDYFETDLRAKCVPFNTHQSNLSVISKWGETLSHERRRIGNTRER